MSDIYNTVAEPSRHPATVFRHYVVRNGKPVLVILATDPKHDVVAELPFQAQTVLTVSAAMPKRHAVTVNHFSVEAGAGLEVRARVDSGALRVVAADPSGFETTIVIYGPGYWSDCTPADQEMADPSDVLAGLG